MDTETNNSESTTINPRRTENEIVVPGLSKEENSNELSQLKQIQNDINQEIEDDDDDIPKKNI